MLVDEIVDEVARIFILQLSLRDARFGKELFQLGVDILQIKSLVGIPSHVADVLEVCRQADILFLELPFLSLLALLLGAERRPNPRVRP